MDQYSESLREVLLTLPKATILDLFKALRPDGTVGFDHERQRKTECIDRLMAEHDHSAIYNAIPSGDGAVTDVTPKAKPAAGDALSQLGRLIAEVAGSTVDEAKVRQIVLTEVEAALERSPVVQIEVKRPDGSAFKPSGHVRPEFADILTAASCGLNILLVGPAGCGKTHLAHQVAEALGRPFASVSCTAGMSESALQGWMLPGEGGVFDYVPSDFVRMYEEGGVFLFDEIDAADPNTLLFVNQALANGSFYLPIRKGASRVQRHADFVCIGAANTFGTGGNQAYSGRERLDEATLDRFRAGMFQLTYDTKLERSCVEPELLAWGWSVRKRIGETRLNRVMSTRFLMDATKLIKAGRTVDQIRETYFIGWKTDERSKVEAA